MSTAEVTAAPAKPIKAPKAKKVVKKATHPTYSEMISAAISSLKERSGSSRQAIVKYIADHYKIDPKVASVHVKMALKRGVKSGSLKQMKGNGASGSFRLNESAKPKKATKKTTKSKKPAASKAKKTTTKKAATKKTPKKASKKSPTKKTKTAKKSAAAKKPVAKKASKAKKPVVKKAKK